MLKVEEIIRILNLKPHPEEGGFFVETYRSDENLYKDILPARYSSNRCFGTCIYYLITENSFSSIHKLQSDEIFHFYLGNAVEMINLFPDGSGKIITIGNKILEGELPQVIVNKNIWQGACLKEGGKFALLGTTVAPGFEFIDYENGKKEELIQKYPDYKDKIIKLSR